MKRFAFALSAVLLACSLAACGSSPSEAPPPPLVGAVGSGAAFSGNSPLENASSQGTEQGSSLSEDAQDVDASEYNAYLLKYLAPYGCLTSLADSWTDASRLSPDLLFQAALQIEFRYYLSAMDYSVLYGDAFIRSQVPESWADPNYGCVYPQEQIENITIEYFGVASDLLRTSRYYLPARNGYALTDDTLVETDLLPTITQVKRSGNRAEITFELREADASWKPAGDVVATKVMTVEDKTETFRYISVVDLA